jgi:hypothetical protein
MANTKWPQVSVRLDKEVFEWIAKKAERQRRSKASVAREYMLNGMEQAEEENPEAVSA